MRDRKKYIRIVTVQERRYDPLSSQIFRIFFQNSDFESSHFLIAEPSAYANFLNKLKKVNKLVKIFCLLYVLSFDPARLMRAL